MSLLEPCPGLVIRYGFLWSHEAHKGAQESSKDRPCTIIVAAKKKPNDQIQTILAPITHTPPSDASSSLELPSETCRKLGLDDSRHWIRFDELNRFEWPGFDLRPKPGTKNDYVYGDLPKSIFNTLKSKIINRAKAGVGTQTTPRD